MALRPLMFAQLAKEWHLGADLTDASWWGGASLHSDCSLKEITDEARLVSPNGWFTNLMHEMDDLSRGGGDGDLEDASGHATIL